MVTILLLWASSLYLTVTRAHSDECRTIELMPHIKDKILESHAIRTLAVLNEDVCEFSCYREPNCVSYNYSPEESGIQSCDLNDRNHEQVANADLVPKYGSIYRAFLSPCQNSTCLNNATCQTGFTSKGYRCLCSQGYHGQHCEIDIDECRSSPCNNGGTCINRDGGFECSCGDEWTGTYCETGRIIICEGDKDEIKCSGERKIKVLFANYGRLDNHTCPGPGQNKDTDCRDDMSEDRVRNHCQGQPSCIITSNKSFFNKRDPCGGIFKYLLMEYRCEN